MKFVISTNERNDKTRCITRLTTLSKFKTLTKLSLLKIYFKSASKGEAGKFSLLYKFALNGLSAQA